MRDLEDLSRRVVALPGGRPMPDRECAYYANGAPVLDSPSAGGILLHLLDCDIHVERSILYMRGLNWYVGGPPFSGAFGEGSSLGEACARFALARGYWRKEVTDEE